MRRFMSKCYLLVVKASPKTQTVGNSKPCQRCIRFLQKTGIKRIYYSVGPNIEESINLDKGISYVMEKTCEIRSDHVSAKYRNPWSQHR